MSGHPSQQQWPYYDSRSQLRYRYDQSTNEFVFINGHRIPRPPQEPRSMPPAGWSTASSHNYPQSSQQHASPTQGTAYIAQPAPNQYPTSQAGDNLSSAFTGLAINSQDGNGFGFPAQVSQRNGIRFVSSQDPTARVQTIFATGPAERITEPKLLAGGVRATRMLFGSPGDSEPLYSNFKLQKHGFFVVGRVFRVLWAEPAGETRTFVTNFEESDRKNPGISSGRHDEKVYSKVRLFVIVRAEGQYCSALPVMSYGGRGVAKPGVVKHEHAIIHTGSEVPEPQYDELPGRGERPMRDRAIRVVPDNPADKLDPMSRIDFGKVHTVQHNIKAKSYGMVHQNSRDPFVTQFANVWMASIALAPPAGGAASSSSSMPVPASNAQAEDEEEDDDEGNDEDENQDDEETVGDGRVPVAASVARSMLSDTSSSTRVSENAQAAKSATDAITRLCTQGYTQEQAFYVLLAKLQHDRQLSREDAYQLLQGWTGYRSTGSSVASSASAGHATVSSSSTTRTSTNPRPPPSSHQGRGGPS